MTNEHDQYDPIDKCLEVAMQQAIESPDGKDNFFTVKTIDGQLVRCFNRPAFLKKIGVHIYGTMKPPTNRASYQTVYDFFKKVNGNLPFSIEPEPIPLENIKGKITKSHITNVEIPIVMLYTIGLSFTTNLSRGNWNPDMLLGQI